VPQVRPTSTRPISIGAERHAMPISFARWLVSYDITPLDTDRCA
jgi:hypothetical protein